MASWDAAAASWEALTSIDDLLGDILIRLPTLADLGRAAASYAAFCRAIVDPAFLRRLHARHPQSLLGLHTFAGFHPVDTPAARAVAAAADFDFSFLPSRESWMVRDACGGRFLLDDSEERIDDTSTTIAVCDPLFRRHVLLPPIPEDLVAAVENPHSVNAERRCLVFLAPGGEEDEAAAGVPEPFRVVWMAQCPTKLVAFVFSSTDGQWRKITSSSWRDLDPDMPSTTPLQSLACRNHGYHCFYWMLIKLPLLPKLLVLDMSRMEFSVFNFPASCIWVEDFAMVELGGNKLGMFASKNYQDCKLLLFSADRQNHGEGAIEWELENEVSLPHMYRYHMLGVVDEKLLLQATPGFSSAPDLGCCISLDFRTLQVHRIRGLLNGGFGCPMPVLYTGYPSSLSTPTI